MPEEYWEKHRMDLERDLGIGITPYTEEELEILYRFVNEAAESDPGEELE